MSRNYKKTRVSHYIGLSGIGGVQRNFTEYLNYAISNDDNIIHKVYTFGSVDDEYCIPIKVYNIKIFFNFVSFIIDIISNRRIIHFYNNISSVKVALLLLFLPSRNLIFHERGSIWNLESKKLFFVKINVRKSRFILANSRATQIMLVKKFFINEKKIKVLHNGINIDYQCTKNKFNPSINTFFHVGFIGRLDTPKGADVAIQAMQYLTKENVKLTVAGDGVLKKYLISKAKGLKNIKFIGRVSDPYAFISQLDMLIVPSLREPLGNVCLEAGLCYTPVLASNVDGIPEIITHGFSGELINPKLEATKKNVKGELPIPEFVVDPSTEKLRAPLQVDPKELGEIITNWRNNPDKIDKYAKNLHAKVVSYFNIGRYTRDLHRIYMQILKSY